MSGVFLTFLILFYIFMSAFAGDIGLSDSDEDKCRNLISCATCLEKRDCTWCVTKSRCTQQLCGNDNVIYPKHIKALMSGNQFCPRIVEKEESIYKSGQKVGLVVKITQIYLYMAFTPWKCKIIVNSKETVVPAVLIADEVYCQNIELNNDTDSPYVSGSVTVMWNYNKSFDGSLSFKVCRTDSSENCTTSN